MCCQLSLGKKLYEGVYIYSSMLLALRGGGGVGGVGGGKIPRKNALSNT